MSMSGVLRGGLGGSNPGRSGSWRISGRDLAAEVSECRPRRRKARSRNAHAELRTLGLEVTGANKK